MAYTIAEKIDIGKTSAYLVAEELEGGKRHGDTISEKHRILLTLVADTIYTQYLANPTDTSLVKTTEYLLRLSKFKDKAYDDLSGGGGGSVTTTTPGLIVSPYYWTVAVGSSPMGTGDSTHTFTEFIGFNVLFTRGGVPQSQVVTEPTSFGFNSTTGGFTCSPALVEGEILSIIPV